AAANLTAPTATDNCDGKVQATTDVVFPMTASATVTWTYEDAAGNTATQTQQVTIKDTTSPEPNVSDLQTFTEGCPIAAANLTAPTATDNCDGKVTATTDVVFPMTASATVTWTYEDATGNTATQTQQVTCPLGAADHATESWVFPNPSGRYVEVRSSVRGTFKILSLSGKPLLEGTANTRLDIGFLQSGLYLVQLSNGRLLKFIKE
ncbi:MAG: T9SS type A sorting domain-containing protein, partial [Ekhidna sp.]|nr:T9SS type A sorting domain-containing protein [Ekhidna sp.]